MNKFISTSKILKIAFIAIFFTVLAGCKTTKGGMNSFGNELMAFTQEIVKAATEDQQANGYSSRTNNIQIPKYYEKYKLAGNKFIQSISFPKEENKLGFKSLSLGDSIDLRNSSTVTSVYVTDEESQKNSQLFTKASLRCQVTVGTPIVNCTLNNANFGEFLTGKYKDLEVAFGEKVYLSFFAVLEKMPTENEIRWNQFGKARIVSITLKNRCQQLENVTLTSLTEKAKSYFTNSLKKQPKSESRSSSVKNNFSGCQGALRNSEWCKAVNTYANSTKINQTNYVWNTDDRLQFVQVSQSKIAIKIPTLHYDYRTNITVGIKALPSVVSVWERDIKNIKQVINSEVSRKNQNDF